jgi:hypothetical protein
MAMAHMICFRDTCQSASFGDTIRCCRVGDRSTELDGREGRRMGSKLQAEVFACVDSPPRGRATSFVHEDAMVGIFFFVVCFWSTLCLFSPLQNHFTTTCRHSTPRTTNTADATSGGSEAAPAVNRAGCAVSRSIQAAGISG